MTDSSYSSQTLGHGVPGHGVNGRAVELRAQRIPFVSATVVRAEKPTSAKPGDSAIVLGDGTIEGFVGGVCSETSVRVQAMQCLASQQSVLLRVTPAPDGGGNQDDVTAADPVGQVTVANPCLSGGTLEIFLEPIVPPPLVYAVGSGPIALALSRGAAVFGFDLRLVDALPGDVPADTGAVVVASHGRGEEDALAAALKAEVPYIGLVASRRRGSAVIESLNLPAAQTDRVRSPAGLDIGAKGPEEVALSILAQIVADRTGTELGSSSAPATSQAAATETAVADAATESSEEIDPVCSMTVAAVAASLQVSHHGTIVYFCGPGCQQAFTADPEKYLSHS